MEFHVIVKNVSLPPLIDAMTSNELINAVNVAFSGH